MRLTCPLCGERDHREFTYKGDAVALDRPADPTWSDAWNACIHLRDNPAGVTRELWYHGAGCAAWIVAERNTVSHAVISTRLASDVKRAAT